MNKTFTYAGVSTLNGVIKARFANDASRTKVLSVNGHTNIDLIQLKYAMTKEDAVALLLEMNFDNGNSEVRAALVASAEKMSTDDAAVRVPKAPKVAQPAMSLEAIAARAHIAPAIVATDATDKHELTSPAAPLAAPAVPNLSAADIKAQLAAIEESPF
jgi:hypothetical protein